MIFSNRSGTKSLWSALRTPNATLWIVIGLALALLTTALYLPWAIGVLRFGPLPAHELAMACGLGVLAVSWFETVKWFRRGRTDHV